MNRFARFKEHCDDTPSLFEPGDILRAWLGHAVAAVTRPLRHGGNHRYLWALNKAASRTLPKHLEAQRLKVQPYPKFTA
ncbi:MAG TPA: hypothetical protein PKA64_25065 [Myxococcota bacterium]|nr:hypothetical protein [Myxococcota bacterium]